MSTVEEIERAVERLPQEDLARLAAWMDQHQAEAAGHETGPGATVLSSELGKVLRLIPLSNND